MGDTEIAAVVSVEFDQEYDPPSNDGVAVKVPD